MNEFAVRITYPVFTRFAHVRRFFTDDLPMLNNVSAQGFADNNGLRCRLASSFPKARAVFIVAA